jgi:hypothetical protein
MSAYTNAHSAGRGAYPPADGREWVVLLSPDTRRTMSTPEVQAEVSAGRLARETLVWRAGMSEWMAIAAIGELDMPAAQLEARATSWQPPGAAQQLPTQHAQARPRAQRPASSSDPVQELVMTAAVAVIMVAMTLYMLSLGGVFAPGGAQHAGHSAQAADTSAPQQAH